jgi:DNA-directed RNA polymerase subunit F
VSVLDRKEITVAEAKKLLEAQGENLDPLQRRVLDYATKFSKLSPEDSLKMVEELTKDDLIEKSVAVQIVNSIPESVEELRAFLGRQRIISEEAINAIIGIIKKYRSSQ